MVLILECNSEIYAHVKSNPYYLICLRHLNRSIYHLPWYNVSNLLFLYKCRAANQGVLISNFKGFRVKIGPDFQYVTHMTLGGPRDREHPSYSPLCICILNCIRRS